MNNGTSFYSNVKWFIQQVRKSNEYRWLAFGIGVLLFVEILHIYNFGASDIGIVQLIGMLF